MYLSRKKTLRFRKSGGRPSNPWRTLLLAVLIGGGMYINYLQQTNVIRPAFVPTPTATRNPRSYAEEGEAQFSSGKLQAAIEAYDRALQIDPRNVDYWVQKARILIYAQRYPEALEAAQNAQLAAPNSAKAKAIYAWALDWTGDLEGAQAAAVQAIALDSNYAPAHAYYSEILNDSQRWEQGANEAQIALSLDPNSLDAHRAMGYSNESVGNYAGAVEHYKAALAINPNLLPLYIAVGKNYRALGDQEQAIFYFSKANALDPENIEPYLALSRTYYQVDEFGSAAQYLQTALELQPTNPDIHGRLGLIYFHAKNYEGAEPELRLAVYGGQLEDGQMIQAMPLSQASLEYYYTLGNLLAAYSPQFPQYCNPDQAPALLTQALNFAPDNQSVAASYQESMAICREVLGGGTEPTPGPTATP